MAGPLAGLIRQKFPGEYDDLDDATLERAVLSKYPEYKDLVTPETKPVSAPAFKLEAPKPYNPPISVQPEPLPEVQQEEPEQGLLSKIYGTVFEPPQVVTDFARSLSDYITTPSNEDESYFSGLKARAKGFLGGAIEGAASLASPANIITMGRGKLSDIANMLVGGGQAAHGAYELSQGNISKGLGDIGFGTLGMVAPFSRRGVTPEVTPLAEEQNIRVNPKTGEQFVGDTSKPKTVTPSTSREIPEGTVVTIKSGPDVPNKVKQAMAAGFEFESVDDAGNFKFKKTGPKTGIEPSPIGGEIEKRDTILNKEQLKPGIPIQERKPLEPEPESKLRQLVNAPKGAMSIDLPFMTSAAFRQARPLAFTTDWFKAWGQAAKAFGSENASKLIEQSHLDNKYFKPRYEPLYDAKANVKAYKEVPSIAEEIGIKTTDLLNKREEQIASSLAEKIPGYGRYVRASNRAYAAFLNDLRVNKATSLLDQATAMGKGPTSDLVFSKKIADFVNAATGRGRLELGIGKRNLDFEQNAKLLGDVLWSPRNLASQVKFFNPSTYMQAPPELRWEYLKGLGRTLASWGAFSGIAALAGAKVSTDPTNADFGKIKIGNTRIDPGGGYQPITTLLARGLTGEFTSSTTNKTTPLGQGFKPQTIGSITSDFLENRLSPVQKLVWDIINASHDTPVNLGDRTIQLAIPFYVTDIMEAAKDDPVLGALVGPASSVGLGVQTYKKGEFNKPKILPPEFDFKLENPYPLRSLYR